MDVELDDHSRLTEPATHARATWGELAIEPRVPQPATVCFHVELQVAEVVSAFL